MKLRSLLMIFSILLTFSVSGQIAKASKSGICGAISAGNDAPELKLAFGQTISVSPNPLQRLNPILTISAVNIEVYGYIIVNGTGQIVELENLSGKPDGSIINLTGAVNCGTYIIRFDTDAGYITRKFMVI